MGLLTDRAVEYKAQKIRGNAVNVGDQVALANGRVGVVVKTTKRPLSDVLDADDATAALLAEVREAGADDKVSPGFDEVVELEIVEFSGGEGENLHLTKVVSFVPEWGLVTVYV